uniref:Putative hepatoma-derived growth factor n=1 Tax=Panstrongylus lignarius TaxID=156445 RepID=A0A224XN30_9HEMI
MFKTKPKFAPGGKVFAKVRGYPPWPARIEGLADETPNKMRYHVYFYGTGETAVIKAEDVFSFVENKARFGKPKKQKYFTEALLQIEAELSPEEVKLANELVEKHASKQTNADKSDDQDIAATNFTDTSKTTAAPRRSSTSSKPQKQQASSPSTIVVPTPPAINKPKDKKRKAEDIPEDPEAKKLRSSAPTNVTEADTTSTKVSPEVMSRSGRKIKPKRFADFEDNTSEDGSKPIKLGKSKDDDEKEDSIDDSEDYIFASINESEKVKIPLKLNRPDFSDEKSAELWDDMVLKYANSLKKRIESGEKMSDLQEIMNEWTAMKSFEFNKDRAPEEDKQKYEFLHTESLLLEIDINIKSALNLQKAQPDKCIALLDKLNELKITPLMLKKHPELVHTIKKMRKYVGNIHRWNMTEEDLEAFKESAGRIRVKSEHIYNKFKSLFLNPDINNFWEFFNKEVERFQEKTRSMSLHQLFSIVQEPE